MGYRYYSIVTQREQKVRARTKPHLEQMVESGEVVIYDDEVIVSMKESPRRKQEILTVNPAYSPREVFNRKTGERQTSTEQVRVEVIAPPKESESVTQEEPRDPVEPSLNSPELEEQTVLDNVIPFPNAQNN